MLQIENLTKTYKGSGKGVRNLTLSLSAGDIYGFISNDYISVDPYWSACRMDFLGRDDDGGYALVLDTGKIHDVSEKVLHLYHNTDGVELLKRSGIEVVHHPVEE